jgi:hypothetical protein
MVWLWVGTSLAGEEEEPGKRPSNPHFDQKKCGECHKEGKRTGIPLRNQNPLCLSCHEDERIRTELHPTRIASSSGNVKRVPKGFPLHKGDIGCMTCHDSKIQCLQGEKGRQLNPSFLRGGPYVHPYSICYRCHNKKWYEVFDPHKQVDSKGQIIQETCFYCHEKPGKDAPPDMTVGEAFERICGNCHRNKTHPTASEYMLNPSKKMRAHIRSIEKDQGLFLPLSKGNKVYCATCHNPHDQGVFPEGDVRATGSEGTGPVHKRLRVVKGSICMVCHSFGGQWVK